MVYKILSWNHVRKLITEFNYGIPTGETEKYNWLRIALSVNVNNLLEDFVKH